MMLEEMKNNERQTIQNLDDSLEFHGGEVTLKTNGQVPPNTGLKNELSTTFMAFEDRLEKIMQ